MSNSRLCVVLVAAVWTGTAADAHAQAALQSAAITEHVGARIPDLTFTDSSGRPLRINSLLGKPLVISLAYFTCPMLCQLGQNGEADAFRASGWKLGADFRALTVSIDPRDGPDAAREWRDRAAARLKISPAVMDWHYVVGRDADIKRLAEAVGFRYAYDAASGQYSHATALFVVTADGRISRYVYGIDFAPAQVATALSDAAANRTGTPFERLLLRCYHYIPALRRHGGFVVWLLRIGGLMVTLALAGGLWFLWRRDIERHREVEA